MTRLDSALSLASKGFWIFPLRKNGKLPVHKGWQDEATRDPAQITKWFAKRSWNVGVSTSKFGDSQALVVVDVDTKKGKHGDETLLGLELSGLEFPLTLEHITPTGGRHLIYSADVPHKQGTDVLGKGLDIRSKGGLIVAPGSSIDDVPYLQVGDWKTVVEAPAWLLGRLGVVHRGGLHSGDPLPGIDPDRAADRAVSWLKEAPGAPIGSRGSTAYKVAAQLKNFGCTEDHALFLMDLYWNAKCDPPMPDEDLAESVNHAFRYSQEAQGSAAPEAVFDSVEPAQDEEPKNVHPFEKLNSEYAFVKRGAFVLQETTDHKGRFATEHLSPTDMNAWYANKPWSRGQEKPRPISQHWMEWAGRRQFDGVVFAPQQDPGPRWYNLWRGFSVAPADDGCHPAVAAFLEHALVNVCNGDQKLFHWLLGYFAHMVQRPWEKPLVALVFRGKKGTGKNALVERVGALFGPHFLVADDDRYLLSNFNSHLESTIFFALDEAAWAGDKRAEGKLKGLITGQQHNIERKGQEPYRVDNLCRVAILGNEDWLIPASQDERRFAVFSVGEGRMQDRKFFIDMREGMEQGGYACLLRYFLDFDLSAVDVNDAPSTQALTEQKIASMGPQEEWWYDCLTSGHIAGGDWGGEWPDSVPTNRLREAYHRWAKGRNMKVRLETEDVFGRRITKLAPSFTKKKVASRNEGDTSYARFNPGLDRLRRDFSKYIQGEIEWPE